MGYPEPEQRPVNFNDDDSTGPPAYDSSSRNPHKTPAPSTMYSLPGISRPVSGITAEDPFSQLDEYGQTRAESVAKQYRRESSTGQGGRREDSMYDDVDFDSRDAPSPVTARSPSSQKPLVGPYDSNKSSVYPYGASTDAITYIDENFNTYSSRRRKPEEQPAVGPDTPGVQQHFEDLEYAEPYQAAAASPNHAGQEKSALTRFFTGDGAKYPIDQQIEAKRRGSLIKQKRPYICWLLTCVMTGVLIYELVFN
ncbi:hypothetical protein FRB90_002088, partial [Tulasnella sp. 427]